MASYSPEFIDFCDSSILCTPVSILRWVMNIVKKFPGSSTFWSVEKRLLSCFHLWGKQRIEIIYWASIQVVMHGVLSSFVSQLTLWASFLFSSILTFWILIGRNPESQSISPSSVPSISSICWYLNTWNSHFSPFSYSSKGVNLFQLSSLS